MAGIDPSCQAHLSKSPHSRVSQRSSGARVANTDNDLWLEPPRATLAQSRYRRSLAGQLFKAPFQCLSVSALEGEEGAASDALRYVGGAFFTLKDAPRAALRDHMARLTTDRSPIPALRKRGALWVKPELVVGVRHLRGGGGLRHATVQSLDD